MEQKRKEWNICKGCGRAIPFGEYCINCQSGDLLDQKLTSEEIRGRIKKMLTEVKNKNARDILVLITHLMTSPRANKNIDEMLKLLELFRKGTLPEESIEELENRSVQFFMNKRV